VNVETRDRVASEYFEREHLANIWGHSAGSLKMTFGSQFDGWIYWSKGGLISISKIKGTTQNWVQPYDFNAENPPRIRNLFVGCVVDFGSEVSVSVPKKKAADLVAAYNHKNFMRSLADSFKENPKIRKKASTRKKKKSVKKSTVRKKTATKKGKKKVVKKKTAKKKIVKKSRKR
jgi:hypothetical protein